MAQAMPRFRHKLNGSNAMMIDGIEGRTSGKYASRPCQFQKSSAHLNLFLDKELQAHYVGNNRRPGLKLGRPAD
jgi:hypothetical protein